VENMPPITLRNCVCHLHKYAQAQCVWGAWHTQVSAPSVWTLTADGRFVCVFDGGRLCMYLVLCDPHATWSGVTCDVGVLIE
jgi:hypothetical protein